MYKNLGIHIQAYVPLLARFRFPFFCFRIACRSSSYVILGDVSVFSISVIISGFLSSLILVPSQCIQPYSFEFFCDVTLFYLVGFIQSVFLLFFNQPFHFSVQFKGNQSSSSTSSVRNIFNQIIWIFSPCSFQ